MQPISARVARVTEQQDALRIPTRESRSDETSKLNCVLLREIDAMDRTIRALTDELSEREESRNSCVLTSRNSNLSVSSCINTLVEFPPDICEMVDATNELRIEIALLQCQIESEQDAQRQLRVDHEAEKSLLATEWESRERKHAMESDRLKAYIIHLEEVVAARSKAIQSMAVEQLTEQSNQASERRAELSRIEQEHSDKEMRLRILVSDQKEEIKNLQRENESQRSTIEQLSLDLERSLTVCSRESSNLKSDISSLTIRNESTVGLLTDELDQSLLRATKLEVKNMSLHSDLMHARKSILELKRDFSNLENKMESEFNKKQSLLSLQVETLTRRLQVAEQSCRTLSSENSDLVSKIDQLEFQAKKTDKNQVEFLMKQITDLNAVIRDKDFELRLMQKEHKADLLAHKSGYKLLVDENHQLRLESQNLENSKSEYIARMKESFAEVGSVDQLLVRCFSQVEELERTVAQRDTEMCRMEQLMEKKSQMAPKEQRSLGLRCLEGVVIQPAERVADCGDSETMVELSRMVDVMRAEIETLNAARSELTEKFNQAVNREMALLERKTELEVHLKGQNTALANVIILLCSSETTARNLESDFFRNSSIIQTLNDKCSTAEQSMFSQRKSHAEELTLIQLQLLREKESVVNDLERRLLISRHDHD